MSEQEIIQLEIKGRENDDPVPLLSALEALTEFHHTIDKAYIAISGKGKLYKQDREEYKIIANNLRTGSIIAELVIIAPPLIQTALAFQIATQSLSVQNIWELTRNSFSFLKALAESKQKGQKTSVTQHANPYGYNVNIAGDNNTIIFQVGEKVNQTATSSEPNIKRLASLVGKGGISEFKALGNNSEGIILTQKENKLFNPKTFIDKNAIEINAKIYRLDVKGKNGRLQVMDEQYKGDHSFNIIGNQQIAPYIQALGVSSSGLTVLKEIIRHPTGEETLAGFQIIRVQGPDTLSLPW